MVITLRYCHLTSSKHKTAGYSGRRGKGKKDQGHKNLSASISSQHLSIFAGQEEQNPRKKHVPVFVSKVSDPLSQKLAKRDFSETFRIPRSLASLKQDFYKTSAMKCLFHMFICH